MHFLYEILVEVNHLSTPPPIKYDNWSLCYFYKLLILSTYDKHKFVLYFFYYSKVVFF